MTVPATGSTGRCPSGSTRSSPRAEIRYDGPVRGPRGPRFHEMSYAIITVGGKQYRVQEGERLLVDRVAAAEGNTFNGRVLLVGGDGETDLAPSATVTARVVGHVLGEKVRIGKYRRRTGYRRHNGHRSRLTQIEIEAIGAQRKPAASKEAETPTAEAPAHTAHPPRSGHGDRQGRHVLGHPRRQGRVPDGRRAPLRLGRRSGVAVRRHLARCFTIARS